MSGKKDNAHARLKLLIEQNQKEKIKPKLLLHCCCAPCATACLEFLKDGFEIICYFYNPNIADEAEYLKRLRELKNYVSRAFYGAFEVIDGGFDHQNYLDKIRGREDEAEGGARCEKCFELRLGSAHERAREMGAEYFATTLTVSPHKNATLINSVGSKIAEGSEVKYLPTDFKKQGGFYRSVELSGEYGLYRQDFCGCEFSKAQAELRRESRESER